MQLYFATMDFYMGEVLKVMTDTNGFTTHGIDRISVSNVTKFLMAPSAWGVSYLMKEKFTAGFAAWQGNAVEAGVDEGLYNGVAIDECIKIAMDDLNERALLAPNKLEEMTKRTPIVAQMVTNALEQLLPLGQPDIPPDGKRQHEINIPVRFRKGKGGTVNNLGYLDYRWSETDERKETPLVVDLKTTSKSPSSWSLSHGIQAAVYERAIELELQRKPEVKFLYCLTRKKDPFLWMQMDNGSFYLDQFKRAVIRMEKFLSLSDDTQKLMDALPHDPDTFYWKGGNAETLSARYIA